MLINKLIKENCYLIKNYENLPEIVDIPITIISLKL